MADNIIDDSSKYFLPLCSIVITAYATVIAIQTRMTGVQ